MNNYKTIRKNASRKIKALIESATKITSCTQSLDWYSDCWTYGDDITITAEQAKEFYADKYDEIERVWLESDEQDQPIELTIRTWKTTLTLTFGEIEPEVIEVRNVEPVQKPRLTAQQVAKMREMGFVAPLSSEFIEEKAPQDDAKRILGVKVKASESIVLNRALRASESDYGINKSVDLDQYGFLVAKQVQEMKREKLGGYYKTYLEITTDAGVFEFRHDISPRESNLQKAWGGYVDYCRAIQESKNSIKH